MTSLLFSLFVLWCTIEFIIPLVLMIAGGFGLLGTGIYQWLKKNGLARLLIYICILAILLGR